MEVYMPAMEAIMQGHRKVNLVPAANDTWYGQVPVTESQAIANTAISRCLAMLKTDRQAVNLRKWWQLRKSSRLIICKLAGLSKDYADKPISEVPREFVAAMNLHSSKVIRDFEIINQITRRI